MTGDTRYTDPDDATPRHKIFDDPTLKDFTFLDTDTRLRISRADAFRELGVSIVQFRDRVSMIVAAGRKRATVDELRWAARTVARLKRQLGGKSSPAGKRNRPKKITFQILDHLGAHTPQAQVAKKLGISPVTVNSRVKFFRSIGMSSCTIEQIRNARDIIQVHKSRN